MNKEAFLTEDIAEFVHAINEDQKIKSTLLTVLNHPPIERMDLLKKLAFHMKQNGAPQNIVDFMLVLQRSDLASEVSRVLADG